MRLFNHFAVFVGASVFVVTDPAASSSVSLEALRGSTEAGHVTNPAESPLINGMQEDRGKPGQSLLSEGLAKLAMWTGLKGESSKNKGVASVDEALDGKVITAVKKMLRKLYTFDQAFNIVGRKEVALSRNLDVMADPYNHKSRLGVRQLQASYEHLQSSGKTFTDNKILGLLGQVLTPKDLAELLHLARRCGSDGSEERFRAMEEIQFAYWMGQGQDKDAVAKDLFNIQAPNSPELENNLLWKDILATYTTYCKEKKTLEPPKKYLH